MTALLELKKTLAGMTEKTNKNTFSRKNVCKHITNVINQTNLTIYVKHNIFFNVIIHLNLTASLVNDV